MTESAAQTQPDTPPADRLVIRITLASAEAPQEVAPPPPRRMNKGAVLGMVGAVAVLGWFSIGSLRSDPPPPPAMPAKTSVANASPTPAKSIEPPVQQQPDAPLSAINEVIPDVPKSALDTIRGTVRVVMRVTIDNQGAVVAATADDRGPSRYFERLSRESAKQWTFTPARLEDQRTALIRFNFTRDQATAHLSEPEPGTHSERAP